jgi:radical SAM superfamily enzyme YgiQ (UPF0313 family)
MLSFLLIAPRPPWDADFAGIDYGEDLSVTRVAPVAIATVAAFAPAGVEPILLDESIRPVDFDAAPEYVGITANVAQLSRVLELARLFRARGRKVIIGGPHATLDPGAFEGRCDVLVVGEFEAIAEEFYADMLSGVMKPRYDGARADLSGSPLPAWELFDNERALIGVAQTSRGCPFQCNFCDVIQYVGRIQRHKTNAQVIAEVQKLYDHGYNNIQIADDNFTVYRRRAESLLEELGAWNGRDGRDFVMFGTQISVDIANDDKMLALCADAGFTNLFVGIESVNVESLKASGKRQNLVSDMRARVRNIVRHGIDVTAALMVGFDPDTLDIFEQQYAFGMDVPVGTFKISVLTAPTATPLHAEMERSGRLVSAEDRNVFPSAELSTNIVPAQMSREELYVGARWLISRLFHPQAFLHRVEQASAVLSANPLFQRARFYNPPARAFSSRLFLRMMRDLSRSDPEIREALSRVSERMRERPDIAFSLQIMLQNWLLALSGHIQRGSYDPAWSRLPKPPFQERKTAPVPEIAAAAF